MHSALYSELLPDFLLESITVFSLGILAELTQELAEGINQSLPPFNTVLYKKASQR
ncbi:MAG: hypothetical protein P8J87_13080 [Verrucomicrobiales bacterium]|nr:hypothetical protein [Verrucomicrobiales bacterium]